MMDSTVNTGMCRCCASEGAFKDIKSSYHWMGEEEIYSDMLRECFDILLNVSEQGDDGGICEVCITQLRNAINFKKQVLHTEEQFQKHLQNKTLFRPNIVKVEVQAEDDSDDNLGSGDEGFSGNEYEVPIKTEADEPKTRKRAAKATATTTRASAKKAKADATGETSTKRWRRDTEISLETDVSKIMKVIKAPRSAKAIDSQALKENLLKVRPPKATDTSEIDKHLQNIRNILFYSNATPIKKQTGHGYLCAFCPKYFPLPADLKIHTLENHDNAMKSRFMRGSIIFNYIVKIDITGLQCQICEQDIDGLETLMDHLQSNHFKIIHKDIPNHILPFKFEGEKFTCVLCPNFFDYFKLLMEHMHVHYKNYNCDICNAPFVNKRTLKRHVSRHKQGDFQCRICKKVFDTNIRKLCHEKFTHTHGQKRNKCTYCDEKFASYTQRNDHMTKKHGVEQVVFKCLACDKKYHNKELLSRHTKRDHLLERQHECQQCDMKFFRKKALNVHMLTHTGAKRFTCDICLKAFARKDHLRVHLKVHAEDRQHRCELCGLEFVRKFSLKGHMESKKHKNAVEKFNSKRRTVMKHKKRI